MPTYTLGELAAAIDAHLEGDPLVEVSGVAGLETAGPSDLSFLANPRYRATAVRSSAGGIVARTDEILDGHNILRSDNPYLAFARAMVLLVPDDEPRPSVHPSAVVAPGAVIAEDATIGPLAVVEEGARIGPRVVIGAGSIVERDVVIGEGTRLYPRVTVQRGTHLGRSCIVQSGSVLGSDGFGYATDAEGRHHAIPQRGGLVIEDRVEIGANVTIDRGALDDTVIGEGTKIDNLVHVAHNVQIGRDSIIVAQVGIAGSTRIGDHAVIGGQAGIGGHATIGDRVRIGGQAGVFGDLPSGVEVSGYPARPHKQQLRLHALTARLPELFERIRALESKLHDLTRR
jgi:UDP-3-O-[3-hydroxymyristoyl] glucosamine N-acyltransferase